MQSCNTRTLHGIAAQKQVLTTTSGKLLTVSVLGRHDKQVEATSLHQTRSVRDYAFEVGSARMKNSSNTSLKLSLHVSDAFRSYLNDSIQCFLIKDNA